MPQDNIALVRRWFDEIWNQRRPDLIDELIGDESVCYADEGAMRGPREFKERQYVPFLDAFPDLHVVVEAVIGQGDDVVVRWSATGRHTGGGLGFSATNEPASFRGLTWIRLHDGRFVEGWQSSNIPEVLRGLAARSPA